MRKQRKYKIRLNMSLDELVEVKRRGGKVRKHLPFGLTVKEYGRIYTIDGYMEVALKEDPAEISRRLKEVK